MNDKDVVNRNTRDRLLLAIIRPVCVVILVLVNFVRVGSILWWTLIAVGSVGFIVATIIKETAPRRRAGPILLWVLVAIAAGGFLVNGVRKEEETTRWLKELNAKISASNEREEGLRKEIKDIREVLFRNVAPEVMEAPKEVSPAPTPVASREIQIQAPRDGSPAPWRLYVKGMVADPSANVWVILRPTDRSAYWVQPSVAVRGDGTWKVQVYLGRGGDLDVGKQFEIMAIANPKARLREGEVFGGWPEAQWESRVVGVTRE